MTTFQQELQALRTQIDEVDRELMDTLKRRVKISTAIGHLKVTNGRDVFDASREAEMVSARAATGATLGLPEEWTSELFTTILKGCVAISRKHLNIAVD